MVKKQMIEMYWKKVTDDQWAFYYDMVVLQEVYELKA